MTQIISALFDDYSEGSQAVQNLELGGIPQSDISIVANDVHGDHGRAVETASKAGQDAGKGAGVGGALGGLGGLLAGLGLMAIPGLGPVVAAGWLASTVVGAIGGAAIGAAAGGLVGALTQSGVKEDDAHIYAEGVRRGGTLVTARVGDDLAPVARRILEGGKAVDLVGRRAAYQSQGWIRFDETAPTYTVDEVAAERARYR